MTVGTTPSHRSNQPSAWVKRWSHLIKPRGRVLDVACGFGRHAYWLSSLGHPITVVDRAQDAIDAITLAADACEKRVADIENGPWPFAGRQFDAVVVTHYLWRPLLPTLVGSLAPGAVLIYETFASGNETVGKPSRPDFLLHRGELLDVCKGLVVVAFEDGFEDARAATSTNTNTNTSPCFVQRIAAVRQAGPGTAPPRFPLASNHGSD